jgi:hypothetical protein
MHSHRPSPCGTDIASFYPYLLGVKATSLKKGLHSPYSRIRNIVSVAPYLAGTIGLGGGMGAGLVFLRGSPVLELDLLARRPPAAA